MCKKKSTSLVHARHRRYSERSSCEFLCFCTFLNVGSSVVSRRPLLDTRSITVKRLRSSKNPHVHLMLISVFCFSSRVHSAGSFKNPRHVSNRKRFVKTFVLCVTLSLVSKRFTCGVLWKQGVQLLRDKEGDSGSDSEDTQRATARLVQFNRKTTRLQTTWFIQRF